MRSTKFILCISIILCILLPITVESDNHKFLQTEINIHDLESYLKDKPILENIKAICSYDVCFNLDLSNLSKSIKEFENSFYKYILEKKGEETAYEVKLKGFPITKILTF